MDTKKCGRCKESKPLAEFNNTKRAKDGKQTQCRVCTKQYYHNNKESIEEKRKQYRQANKEAIAERSKKYYQANKDAAMEYGRQYYKKNKEYMSEQGKQWYQANKDAVADYNKNYRNKNWDDLLKYKNQYKKKRRATDLNYRITDNLRSRLYTALQGNAKAATTEELLGCTFEQAVAHIEVQFTERMSWDKMGVNGIHIDHIRPCASFDLTDPDQQRECFHYTNLQPLWAKDNLRKADKWEPPKQP